MKILQINSVSGIGSTGRIATDIGKILEVEGHESIIAYGREKSNDCNKGMKIGNHFDNYVHVAKTRLFDRHGFGSKKATRNFIDKVEQYKPDIIHLHNVHGYYLNVELLFEYIKKVNKPVIWTLHDCWPFTGHCSYFDYVNCNRWETGCHSCPQKKSYPASVFIDNSKDNYLKKKKLFSGVKNMTIVTPSIWLAELVKKSFLGEYEVKVINNGIDLKAFKPTTQSNFREINKIKNKFVILGVASDWGKRKGYEYFVELSQKIREDEIIVIVGVTEKQKDNLPTNIIGITKTNSIEDLAEIYSAADVFINPTLEDNFPTTNLEALACGTPVITFNTGGSVESIDNSCGIVVDKGNVMELVIAIEIIKEKGKLSFSQMCIKRAKDLYDKREKFNEYVKEYTNLL
ncbi:glycosyltransferase [Peribacillus simplex]|uniref:glycosyltransferase n=1 Tax=Peribacillus simplex TaxID=1478 RepID=UPI0024BFA1F8|nr:glycosyltransferase [Peribacillus simplex]WHY96092.1 glycosyltransferase [Peribacillus simplex]